YAATRRPDPRIASALRNALGDVASVVNIGAGCGAYEPTDIDVVAVETSQVMIDQRHASATRALLGPADALPLDDASVDAALAVLTIHHWRDLEPAWAEIRRVVRRRAVFLTVDREAPPFWLTRDYLPKIREIDGPRIPPLSSFGELGAAEIRPLPIPHDCTDGFLAAFWRRPSAYLDPVVQYNISSFVALDPHVRRRGLDALRRDLEDGTDRDLRTMTFAAVGGLSCDIPTNQRRRYAGQAAHHRDRSRDDPGRRPGSRARLLRRHARIRAALGRDVRRG